MVKQGSSASAGEASGPPTPAGSDDHATGVVALLAYRRRTLRFAAVLVAACYPIDLFQPRLAEVAVARALWIAVILLVAACQRPDRLRLATTASYLGAIASGAAVVAIVALDGGSVSIYQGMLIATPFAVLVGIPELPWAAGANGAICVLGGAAIRGAEGQPWSQIVSWLLLSSVMSALATWGTVGARRFLRIELATERERRRAVERLADVERERAESERLAEVGRMASRVAHEVNSPLAAVKSNVQWLGGDDSLANRAERAEVVAETLRSVEQILDSVDTVRRQAGERPYRKR